MPTPRKNSAIGTPIRCEARLDSTLTANRTPQMGRRRAVAAGSLDGIGQNAGYYPTGGHRQTKPIRESMSHETFVATLALIGLVILVASLLSGAVERSGLPQVAIFLLLGALLGPAGLGLVHLPL